MVCVGVHVGTGRSCVTCSTASLLGVALIGPINLLPPWTKDADVASFFGVELVISLRIVKGELEEGELEGPWTQSRRFFDSER